MVNPFPNRPLFLRVRSTNLLKTLWEKEKLLVTSNFSFSHIVFHPFGEISVIYIKVEIVVCESFQFGSQKFVVLEGLNASQNDKISDLSEIECICRHQNDAIRIMELTSERIENITEKDKNTGFPTCFPISFIHSFRLGFIYLREGYLYQVTKLFIPIPHPLQNIRRRKVAFQSVFKRLK